MTQVASDSWEQAVSRTCTILSFNLISQPDKGMYKTLMCAQYPGGQRRNATLFSLFDELTDLSQISLKRRQMKLLVEGEDAKPLVTETRR